MQKDSIETLGKQDTLGKLIRAMRICRGETQASLARRLGTCRQHIQKWEYDEIKPSPKRLTLLLRELSFKNSFRLVWEYYIK